jgi:hypothetical protein
MGWSLDWRGGVPMWGPISSPILEYAKGSAAAHLAGWGFHLKIWVSLEAVEIVDLVHLEKHHRILLVWSNHHQFKIETSTVCLLHPTPSP